MRRSDFHYELPEELIAQHPPAERSAGRLLVLDGLGDRRVRDLPELLGPDDLLVVNDTRVIPARLLGRKASGGRVEVLIERVLGAHEAAAFIRASKTPKPGSSILIGEYALEVGARDGQLFQLRSERPLDELLAAHGHVPLPPYIQREDEAADAERYQTVYARTPGAVAAPTAGLHLDQALLEAISARGVARASVTLHVGAGTFEPVRVDELTEHRMHSERIEVPAATVEAVARARSRGGRVVAVGTTSLRALEAAAAGGELRPSDGETDLFITPGYRFRVVDVLLTNLHLPESTLLMLVCAFSGYDAVMRGYRHAIDLRYRFFSYGDAMFLTRSEAP